MTEPISVLVVDDDPWTTRALAVLLDADPELDCVAVAYDGVEAIAAYLKHRPDVVLMDVNMPPGMSGVDATAAIREIDPHAVVVILTTYAPGPGLMRAIEAGACASLRKTTSDETVCAVVKKAARGDDLSLLRELAADLALSGDCLGEEGEPLPSLTKAEMAVLHLVCRGRGYEEIARVQSISTWTAKAHVRKLREKLGAENQAQIIVRALQLRLVTL